jgi:dipeptidyl aminopeptidase/acylaminoacyl peptidase
MFANLLALALSTLVAIVAVPAPAAGQNALGNGVLLAEYGELPTVEYAALSESGKQTAVVASVDGVRVLIVFDDAKGETMRVGVGDAKIRGLRWIGDDRLMLTKSQTENLGYGFTVDKEEFFSAQIVPINPAAKGGFVFANRRDIINSTRGFYGLRQIGGRWYGFFGGVKLRSSTHLRSAYEIDHFRPYLYRVDLENFSAREVAPPAAQGHALDWLIDADGNVAASLDIDLTNGNWRLRAGLDRTIASGTNPKAEVSLLGFGYDGTSLIISESDDEGTEWYEVPLRGGEKQPFLSETRVEQTYFDRVGRLIGYLEGGVAKRPVFRNPSHQSAIAKVYNAFSQDDMRVRSWTEDMGKVIVRTSGNGDSGTWYGVDLAQLRAEIIAHERPRIPADKVGRIEVVEYTAADGLVLDGILTLPPGREAKHLPAVVLPHGGPHAHDTKSFDWWAQAFAARGYAVFQPNFRGSTNRDENFRRAAYGEWGRKMQTDKSDGLKALVERGLVDPKRVCIVGASYGGYAALAGVTLQQGLYRCAVAVAPVSDLGDMYREDTRGIRDLSTIVASLKDFFGPRENWNAVSPLRAAAKADAPIMLIHGVDDIVVPYAHSTRMASALRSAGKPHELVPLKGEDHWLSRSETRRAMLEAAVRFVEQHNPIS